MNATYTTKDMQDKLLSISDLEKILMSTEPLGTYEFTADGEQPTELVLKPGWAAGMKDAEGTETIDGSFKIGGAEFDLTKDALLQMTSSIGLTRDYVLKTPAKFIVEQVNWWHKNMPTSAFNVLAREGEALALTKASVRPISNVDALQEICDGLKSAYGIAMGDLKVDYKAHHDLRSTYFRVIVPESVRNISTARSDTQDQWSVGIDFQNSLTANVPMQLKGYLFAWWCTNGATSNHASSGSYSRRQGADDAMEWARASVDNILGGLEHELDSVEELTKIEMEGSLNVTMRDIFERYRVPARAREMIMASLIDGEDLTAYGVMNAITQAANSDSLSPTEVARLMAIGGDLPGAMADRCKACHRVGVH